MPPTTHDNRTKAQLHVALEAAKVARDRAEAQSRELRGQNSYLNTLLAEQRDELEHQLARIKRVRAALPVTGPVVLVANVVTALDGA